MVDESVARSPVPIADLDRFIATVSECQPLKETEVRLLCEKAREIFYNESNVQPVKCPVTVVGDLYDIHEHALPNHSQAWSVP